MKKRRKKKRKKTYQLTAASCLTFVSGKAQRAQIQEEGGGTLKGAARMRKEGTPTHVCKQEGPLCTCEKRERSARKEKKKKKKVEPEK